MFAYLDFLFLQYSGRIGRTAFWLGSFGLTLAYFGAASLLLHLSHGSFSDLAAFYRNSSSVSRDVAIHVVTPVLIVFGLSIYPTYALYAKRWHDRGKSGWWSLLGFVPIIGLWMFIELGFLGGDAYENAYGTR